MKKGIGPIRRLTGIFGLSLLFANAVAQQPAAPPAGEQKPSPYAVTMPTPKLPYNMPLTQTREELFQIDRERALAEAKKKRGEMNRAALATPDRSLEPTATKSEVLRWSHPEKTLKVSVNEEGARGPDTSTPVGELLGKPASVAPAVPLPQRGLPMESAIPTASELIANAGGNPEPFGPSLPEGVEEAPATVPATPPPAAVPEKKRGLFKRIFSKKRDKNLAPEMAAPPVIATGPQGAAPPPVAPGPDAETRAAMMSPVAQEKKYVVVENEAGTQFVIAGETANGQSGVLVPKGVVLQVIGKNGQWTTVKSPNGTIGSVQAIDIRPADFDESIRFITAESSQEESGN